MATRPLDDAMPTPSPSIAFLRSLVADGDPGSEDVSQMEPEDLLRTVQDKLEAFLLPYEFGLKEILTKIEILSGEYEATLPHNPIEHVKTRVKSMDSLLGKLVRTQCPPELEAIRANIRDIGGARITCAYVEDCYKVARALAMQPDITLLEEKDYIHYTKPNGYRSLHLIVEVPVYLSTRAVQVPIEIQIRTIAMDFWASAEHELIYKYKGELPEDLRERLRDIAETTASLDEQMSTVRDRLTAPATPSGSWPSHRSG